MIVSRTPLRISFLGGGTDYPAWSNVHGGAVLSATIDKYCYLTVRRLPPFFAHRNRIVYRLIETTGSINEIKHPTVRTILQYLELEDMEIHHDADLPARSGMGTSSAFTVGLLNACHALRGSRRSKFELAHEALHVEQTMLRETVGSQDQIATAHGGLNHLTFRAGVQDRNWRDAFSVDPVPLRPGRLDEFHRYLLLFYTGISRTASKVAETFVPELAKNQALASSGQSVETGLEILTGSGPIEPFGELLDTAWMKKRALSEAVSTPEIDGYYTAARGAGAIGGKLLGAGGGGFMLFFAHPKNHDAIRDRLGLLHVPFRFESDGSRIMVYDP